MFRLHDSAVDAGFGISIRIEPASTRDTTVSSETDPRHGLDIRIVIHADSDPRPYTTSRSSTISQATIGPIRQYVE
ncbi:MAG: hypothetical protein IPP94_15990 [Ignavibacteria bacterium]|nr:hypothetical protein [Ignavibacteria bacterium]